MDETWWTKPEQLDDDQRKVIDLPLDGSYLLCGPPGSGKTNLLLLRAAFLHRGGKKNIVIITYNRMLKEFLATGTNNYPFSPDKIQTFRSWGGKLLRDNGVKLNQSADYEQIHESIVQGLKDLSQTGGKELKYDCILLDESQDYSVDDVEVMRSFSKDIFAVGDGRQRIYKADGSLAELAKICEELPSLEYHYRNGTEICKLADGIMGDEDALLDTSNYDEDRYPSKVKVSAGLPIVDQVATAVGELATQLEAYPDEWIGVLAPRHVDLKAVWEVLESSALADKVQLQRYDSGYDKLDPTRPIIVTTCHSAKGLEFRTVHLMAAESLKKMPHGQRLAYMAATRAKTTLHIFHEGELPGYLERGIAAVEGPPAAAPKIEDLFGGGF